MESNGGYWDPRTSTVDWCESNYTVIRYCAEAINVSTNIIFFYLGLKGIAKHRHDPVLFTSYIGQFYLTVGIGSFLFQATLKCKLDLIPTTLKTKLRRSDAASGRAAYCGGMNSAAQKKQAQITATKPTIYYGEVMYL